MPHCSSSQRHSAARPPRYNYAPRHLNRPATSIIHSIDDLFESNNLLLNDDNYEGGFPNLSSAKNITIYALEALGVDINSMTMSEQNDLIRAVYALADDLNSFDVTKSCVLCGYTGHTFSDYTTTQPAVLKNNFIKLRLLVNRF